MNGGLHTSRLTDEQLSFKCPRAATIKIRYAPSKSVSVAADTQTHPAHYCHTLAFPTRNGFEVRFASSLKFSFTIVLLTIWVSLKAQVIPDLVMGDNYRPYLTEEQKRQEIFKAPKSKTSQELYPDLYKYQNQNQDNLDKLIKQGLIPDPNATFKNQAKIGFNSTATPTAQQTTYGIPKGVYEPGLTIQQRNQMMIEADMAAYETQKRQQEQLVSQALNEFGPTINYNLGVHSKGVDRFVRAFSELQGMLNGAQKIDFLKAVYLVESSHDVSLTWEEFNRMFQDNLQLIMQLMKKDKLSPSDNLSKIMATYKFMADTTSIYMAAKEKNVVSKPMLYDFEDYAGKEDITKVFVSKLLRTGTGQCMSLPMLYYLFAKALGAEVNLAFAPQHSYIMFKDKVGVWQNIELTGRIFTTNDFNWQSGFIKMEQVKSGMYMRPISEKETIAHLLTTLAITYARTFGTDDRVLEMALTANEYAPNDVTSNMIMTGYANELWKNVQRQYQVYNLPADQLTNDEKAQAIKQTRDKLLNHLYKDLGWSKIPDEAYKKWLDGVNELAIKRQHLVRRRQLEQQLNR